MKTFNLIKWLWTDSREKQSPQRFARYAAMLIMLLTLGVGQMWATDLYVRGYNGTWDANSTTKMSGTSSPWTFTAKYWSNAGSFKIADNSWGSINCGSASITFGSKVNMTNSGSSSNMSFSLPTGGGIYTITVTLESGTYKIKVDKVVEEGNSWVDITDPTVYFDNSAASYSNVSIVMGRVWSYGSNGIGHKAVTLSNITNTSLYYTQSIGNASGDASKYTTMLFANASMSGWTASKQATQGVVDKTSYTNTNNATLNSDMFLYKAASGSKGANLTKTDLSAYTDLNKTQTIQVRISENNGSTYSNAANFAAWPGSITVARTYLSSATASSSPSATAMTATTTSGALTSSITFTGASTTEYTFAGWSDSSTGPDGNTSKTYTITDAATKYAFYKRKQYTVSYGVNSSTRYGSITLNSGSAVTTTSSSTLNHGTAIAFTASPNSGYQVEGWYSDAACSAVNRLQSGGTSYDAGTLTAAKTVYVKFETKTGGIITLSAGSNGQVSADNSSWGSTKYINDITTATDVNIYARGNTGYQFSSWTKSSGSGTIKTNAASGVFTTVAYGDATLTASFSETKSTITVTTATSSQGTLKFGSTSKSWGATASLGVATTQSITATAAAGFRFVRWDLSGAAASSSTLTNTTITLKADGSGSTGTATAVFEEDLSSPWIVAGGNKIVTTGTTWRTTADANNTMLKKTGHSTESVVYFTVPVTTVCSGDNNGNFQFKIYNTSTSKWYGLFASGSSYYLLKAEDGTEKSLVEGNKNIELRAYVTGDYEFKLDYSTSTPKLTVTWPVFNQVRISAASPTDATNVGNFDLSDPVSNVRSVKRSLNANTTYTFKIVYNSDFYGYNSGTFTRSTSTSSNSRTISTSGGDMTLTTDYAGDYTFKFNQSTKALSVDFPTAYKITFGKGSVDGTTGSFSAVDLDNGSSAVTSNSTWVKSGDKVKITAPSAKSGYRFLGWYDNNSATGDAITTLANCTITVNTTKTVYACYAENLTAITITTDGHGTITTPSPNSSPYSLGVTTGQAINASASTGYHWNTWTVSGTAALGTTATTASNTAKGNGTNGSTGTVTATFSPNTYTITLHEQGATTHGSPSDGGEITVTYDANTNLGSIASLPERTGYTFNGYYDNAACTGSWIIKTDKYFNWDGTYINSSTGVWKYDGDVDLYAKWVANQYTVTLDVDEANKGTIAGATTSQDIYYDDATVTVPNRPTAANGYALDGYYTDQLGEGTKVINADGTWIASVEGYTDASKHWIHAGDVTLYAYYKKAEITALTLDAATVVSNGTVYVKPTIDPTPTGTTKLSWYILYANGNKLASQPTISGPTDGKYSFTAPEASGMYIIAASLRTGTGSHPYYGGTLLDSTTVNFQVAGTHTVTVRYKCDDETIKASTSLEGIRPLDWSDDVTAPTITGYSFTGWEAGDGVTIKDAAGEDKTSSTYATIKIKAIYDGYLTANYSKKRVIYFNNTLNWENVYVYFYKNGTYWNATYGTGCNKTYPFTDTPFSEGLYGQMEPIEEGSKIYYFDAEAAGVNASYQTVVFTELDQHTYNWFSKTGDVKNKVIKRDDYYSTKMPMYVPLAVQTPETMNNGLADYYWQGYWMNYPENSGYTLKIYNEWNATKETGAVREFSFPYSDDLKMPLKLDVEFNDAGKHEYWFMVYRNDGTYLGNTYTFNQNYNSEQIITGGNNKSKLITSAPGKYTLTLTYHDNGSGTVNYYIDVDFPIALNDYRIIYKDNATWSKGAHGASWNHPSDVIVKIDNEATEAKEDIVSFYISKGAGITNTMKFQYASSINASTGAVTWTDVPSGTIDLSDYSSVITKAGVYNFHITQPVGGESISVEKVEPYTGNYYIRTDCAGSTKWDSYKTLDHQMTYSDYAEKNSGFTHYYAHWVTTGQNVKFCIANDYSPCISDTIAEDYGTTIANITAEGNSGAGTLNSGNANIRFMWNQATNKISRAYISGSSNISDRFLVLEGDAKMYDKDGNALSISGLNANEINLVDDQNFVYEQTIQVNTSARAKLTAKYNNIVQYFRGSEGAFADGTTVELLGGSASGKHKMRIVYDFKTNRLVTAYLPSGTIDESMAINADLMIVREHQEAGEQITFSGSGALSDVHTVYGVMRFNRWTLNNKEKTGGHSPVGDPKSVYERSLYWISFPFDVNLSDVFGFGTYGVDWIIEYYDGAERATNGYWKDSPGFWKMVMPAQRASYLLEAGKGYVLAIDIDRMKDNNTDFWTNNIEQVELFFPSATNTVGAIAATNVTTSADEHTCTIDRRTDKSSPDINKDRTKADSHWNMIGVPSYANYGTTIKDGKEGSTITWRNDPTVAALPYLYEWNMVDDSYTVQSGTTYPFKAMHSYMVQYYGNLYWSLASATPSSIVARRTYDEAPQNAEFRLELQQNEKMVDQTFVKLSNDEQVNADFVFDEDLCKEYNGSKANIYTFIENYIPAAGNTLPMSNQTTVVPVGVKITATGDYTFAIPDGTSGIGVTLIDTENNIRTSLSALSYTVNLTAGTHDGRFLLEIAPIQQTPTDIEEVTGDGLEVTGARKVIIDQKMYIIRDGKMYDARGAMIK